MQGSAVPSGNIRHTRGEVATSPTLWASLWESTPLDRESSLHPSSARVVVVPCEKASLRRVASCEEERPSKVW